MAVSARDTCGLKNDGTVVCWGGFTPTTHAPNPGNDTAKGFTAISAGGGKYCGLKKDRSLFCWGNRSDVPDTKKTAARFPAGESLARMNTSPCRQIIPASSESVPAKLYPAG